MITWDITREMAREFNVRSLQEIGIAAERFVNMLDDMNNKPWAIDQKTKDTLHGLRMLADACKIIIAAQS